MHLHTHTQTRALSDHNTHVSRVARRGGTGTKVLQEEYNDRGARARRPNREHKHTNQIASANALTKSRARTHRRIHEHDHTNQTTITTISSKSRARTLRPSHDNDHSNQTTNTPTNPRARQPNREHEHTDHTTSLNIPTKTNYQHKRSFQPNYEQESRHKHTIQSTITIPLTKNTLQLIIHLKYTWTKLFYLNTR